MAAQNHDSVAVRKHAKCFTNFTFLLIVGPVMNEVMVIHDRLIVGRTVLMLRQFLVPFRRIVAQTTFAFSNSFTVEKTAKPKKDKIALIIKWNQSKTVGFT